MPPLSIKHTLLAILLLGATTTAVLLGHGFASERAAHTQVAQQSNLAIARLAAAQYDAHVAENLRLLAGLAHAPGAAVDTCDAELLRSTHAVAAMVAAIATLGRDGNVACSWPPAPPGATFAGQPWLQAGHGGTGFVVSGVLNGPIVGRRVVVLGVPTRGGDGWHIATIDIERFELPAIRTGLPPGTVFGLLATDGELLFRYPPLTGNNDAHASEVVRTALSRANGAAVLRGIDGQRRVYGFSQMHTTGWHIHVGVPYEQVMAPANQALRQSLRTSALIVVVFTAISVILYRAAMRAGTMLSTVAGAIARAEWSLRLPVTGPRELADAAAAVNSMLDARAALEREARAQRAVLQGVFDTAADGIVLIDSRGTVRLFNRAAERIFGYRADEIVGGPVETLMPEPDRSAHRGHLQRHLDGGERGVIGIGRELVGRRRDGEEFPLDLAVGELVVDGERMFTGIVRDIGARKHAERSLQDALAQVRQMSRALVDVHERERRSIAHELHDQIGQALTAARIRLQLLLRHRGIDADDEDAQRLAAALDGSLASVRALSRSLRPPQLDHLGLAAALRDLAVELFGDTGVRLALDIGELGTPRPRVAVALYRIAQEALTNAARHAGASEVTLAACRTQDGYVLRVVDDGAGFVSGASEAGIGVEGMHERAGALGGRVEVRTGPGLGTEVHAVLPA